MSMFGSVIAHHPDTAQHLTADGFNWVSFERKERGESLSIHTTAARAAAMAFAFSHPETVLALAEAAPVTIVTDPEGVA